jgi:uncharacterized protein (DUF2236 family)
MLPFFSKAGLRVPVLEEGRDGDPGFFGPRSLVWRIGRERVLLLGGPAALLLQIAHPLVAAGVADHSDFQRQPYERLSATLDATLRITFGDTEQADASASRVAATHRRIKGNLRARVGIVPSGTAYTAEDPELALWVHATLVTTALDTYDRFVRPLSMVERERYFEETKRFAALFGAGPAVMPPTYAAFRGYVESIEEGPVLSVGADARGLAEQILNPPLPRVLRPASRLSAVLAASLLPSRLREGFGLSWNRRDRALLGAFTRSVRYTVAVAPPSLRFWPHYGAARRRTDRTYHGG